MLSLRRTPVQFLRDSPQYPTSQSVLLLCFSVGLFCTFLSLLLFLELSIMSGLEILPIALAGISAATGVAQLAKRSGGVSIQPARLSIPLSLLRALE